MSIKEEMKAEVEMLYPELCEDCKKRWTEYKTKRLEGSQKAWSKLEPAEEPIDWSKTNEFN